MSPGQDEPAGMMSGPAVALLLDGSQFSLAVGRCAALAGYPRAAEAADLPAGCTSVVVSDSWDAKVQRRTPPGVNRLPVYRELRAAIIGPLVRPGARGCDECARLRRLAAAPQASPDAAPDTTPDALAGVLPGDLVGRLTAAMLAPWTAGAPHRAEFLRVDLLSLSVRRHRFIPHPACDACGGLPEDSAEAARMPLRSHPKPAVTTFRAGDVMSRAAELEHAFVDPVAGVVREVRIQPDTLLPRAVAVLGSTRGQERQYGWGRSLDELGARVTAVLEALERLGGERPVGRRTTVLGSYRELEGAALDPRSLGLYPDQRYAEPDLPFLRYHEDLPMSWVWAYSLVRQAPVLVPERYAYYALHSRDDPRIVYEISNGCALGSCLAEAVLHGLLEVAERDAFLMTWYARLPVPQVEPSSAQDRRIPLLIEQVSRTTGYRISLFAILLEQRVPCLWALAVDSTGDPARPRAFCVAGAAPLPELAALNALHELVHLLGQVDRYSAEDRAKAARMAADPTLVRVMGDHSLLYCHEDAFDRFDFLRGTARQVTFGDVAAEADWPAHTDLRDDVREAVGRYAASGLDVIVVDQTGAEHRAGGLRCVKVIVPGALPMTFGHHARRVDGLPRLFTVPHLLGYTDRPLTSADLNPHPHPFP